jgi:hypothetical protein
MEMGKNEEDEVARKQSLGRYARNKTLVTQTMELSF